MTGRNGNSPYLDLDRDAWRSLRASTPMSLTAEGLDAVRGLSDPIQLSEVEDIYLPLSRLLRLYFEASARLRKTVGAFLGQQIRPAPFIIAVAGSVAVGKSTTARLLQTLVTHWPQQPHTELVTTDNFLYPNADLERRGLADRKGFPESYDRRALLRFVQQVRAGAPEVTAPVYSHVAYDILPGQRQSVQRPDVLILEGINVLQPAPAGALALADFFDFSVYVDARTEHIRQWFLSRLHALRDTAFTDPQSPFRRLTQVSAPEVDSFGTQVWKTINEVNLIENIQPTRARATIVLHKEADHSVSRVRLRRFLAQNCKLRHTHWEARSELRFGRGVQVGRGSRRPCGLAEEAGRLRERGVRGAGSPGARAQIKINWADPECLGRVRRLTS